MAKKILYLDGVTGLGEHEGDKWPYAKRYQVPSGDPNGVRNHIFKNEGRFYSDALGGDWGGSNYSYITPKDKSTGLYPWVQAGGWMKQTDLSSYIILPYYFYRGPFSGSNWLAYSGYWLVYAETGQLYSQSGAEWSEPFTPIASNEWFWFEYRMYSHTSAGILELRVNETATKRWTGKISVYTSGVGVPTGEIGLNAAEFLFADYWSSSKNSKYDDLYVMFADTEGELEWLGKSACEPLYVMGAGTDQECTPRGPSNFASVEFPVNDVLYVSAVADSEKDCYSYSNLETDRERNIAGLKVTARAKRNGVHTRKIRCYCRVSGTNYYGDTHYLSPEWREYIHIWAVNPNTGIAWTAEEVNNTQYGFERVA